MGYFAGVPGRFFESYPAIYHTLILKQSHALDGRGKHSFFHLKEVGQMFAYVPMLVWAMAIHGELKGTVFGINQRTQFAGDLPWECWRALEGSCESHRHMIARLGKLRAWLRVLVVVMPYVLEGRSLRCFWAAYCLSPSARVFHAGGTWHLPAHLFQI